MKGASEAEADGGDGAGVGRRKEVCARRGLAGAPKSVKGVCRRPSGWQASGGLAGSIDASVDRLNARAGR